MSGSDPFSGDFGERKWDQQVEVTMRKPIQSKEAPSNNKRLKKKKKLTRLLRESLDSPSGRSDLSDCPALGR